MNYQPLPAAPHDGTVIWMRDAEHQAAIRYAAGRWEYANETGEAYPVEFVGSPEWVAIDQRPDVAPSNRDGRVVTILFVVLFLALVIAGVMFDSSRP